MQFDYSRFYLLEEGFEPRALRVDAVDDGAGEPVQADGEESPAHHRI